MSRTRTRALAAAAALLAASTFARAQDAPHGEPSAEDIKKKVVEIEHLMKEAEESLVRSLSESDTSRTSAERMEKLLDEKARGQSGQSAAELRKLAEGGSREAAETLRRLTEEASKQMQSAAEGVRQLLEETKADGKSAAEHMQWILDKAVSSSGGGSGQQKKQKPETEEERRQREEQQRKRREQGQKEEEEEKEQPRDDQRRPDRREGPRTPEQEQWLAQLPPQVRNAYLNEDWDSIPPQWRDILREWTKKMADEMERGRR